VSRLFGAVRPLLLGVMCMSAIPLVDRFMASRFPAGAISALAYADRVVQIPITIIATAVTTATFPTFARHAVERDVAAFRRTFATSIKMIATALLPVAVLLAMFSQDIVTIVFERGRFTATDTRLTSAVVSGLALGTVFMGTLQLVPRAFNALQLAPLVAVSGALNLVFKTVFNLLLVPALGYIGFAFASSAMYLSTGGIMLYVLSRRIHGLELKALLPSLATILIGAALMAAAAQATAMLLAGMPVAMRVLGVCGASAAVYIGAVWWAHRRIGRMTIHASPTTDREARIREAF
jgi:putative peptidoglycan lipid II flippase